MAYDEGLAERIREALAGEPALVEKKMFGGLAFLLNGNMCCGVIKDELMVRVGPAQHEAALATPGAREMDFTHRPMKGMVLIGADSIESDHDLADWVRRGARFASSLPPK
jgi:TfoX/Sxy family transcriptional regulator of competence genes